MKKWQTGVIQGLLTLIQIANLWLEVVPPKAKIYVALGIGSVQIILQTLAHNWNPDGSPAAVPYLPPPSLKDLNLAKKAGIAWLLLPLTLAVVACTTVTLTGTANTLADLGTEFVATGKLIDAAYVAKEIPEADYDRWRAFVPKFKGAFAQAERTMTILRDAGAAATPEQQTALVRALKDQLLAAVLAVYKPAARRLSDGSDPRAAPLERAGQPGPGYRGSCTQRPLLV